jgi:hypothetical protein
MQGGTHVNHILALIAILAHGDAEVRIHANARSSFDINWEVNSFGGEFRIPDAAVATALVLCDG